MSIKTASFLLIFAAVFSLSAAKQDLFDLKVETEMISPPLVNYSGAIGFTPPKSSGINKWLMIRCRYASLSKGSSRAGAPVSLYLDDVEMDVRVLFFPGIRGEGIPEAVLYTGKVLFWTIRMDGGRREALMFLPGQLIDRVAGAVQSTVPVVTRKDFSVEVTFRHQGAVVGRTCCNVSGGNSAGQEKKFQLMAAKIPADFIFEGAVLSRGKSPWAGYFPDRYDPEKESSSVGSKR